MSGDSNKYRFSLPQSTVKIEQTTSLFCLVSLLVLYDSAGTLRPFPPHGFQCRRSRFVRHRRPLLRTLPATPSSPPATPSRGRLRLSPDFSRKQMVTHNRPSWLLVLTAISFSLPAWPAISTSTPTPPLQWLNITRLLSGPSAPPLKGASVGYDDQTRTLLVFGGESESGFPTSTTYLYVPFRFPDVAGPDTYRTYLQSQFGFSHLDCSDPSDWSRRRAAASKQCHRWIRFGCKSATMPYRDWWSRV
jgi:hypothetical protein